MTFRFKRKESVAKGVRRLSEERLERAQRHLQAGAQVEAIHRVRKDIKKLRAVLRLVRGEIGARAYRHNIEALREAANYLAGARDANVRLQSLAKLTAYFQPDLSAQSFRQVKAALHRSSREETERFVQSQSSGAVRRILRRLGPALEKLGVRTEGWAAVGPGVQASYAQGRRAYHRVQAEPMAENFHEWRKGAKDLWYQVRLLRPIWPEQMCMLAGELSRLTELLGEDHDLLMLEQAVVDNNCQTNGSLHEAEVL
ncbi:MAG TPA: CHAD domain-containing protein, partial [Candidatus Sulfotelmatobacter sp.]|nr:CHAD domain-containing protein [Candidatus Sulfotelmatobacter sp.]